MCCVEAAIYQLDVTRPCILPVMGRAKIQITKATRTSIDPLEANTSQVKCKRKGVDNRQPVRPLSSLKHRTIVHITSYNCTSAAPSFDKCFTRNYYICTQERTVERLSATVV